MSEATPAAKFCVTECDKIELRGAGKCFDLMVARDGVEPPTPAFSGLAYVVV
jgi:hypothetical protein